MCPIFRCHCESSWAIQSTVWPRRLTISFYQLSLSNTSDRNRCDRHKTHFPIFATTNDNAVGRIDKRLSLMHEQAADMIRAMQPYKRSASNPYGDVLWVLYQLDVIDKHRVVLAVNQLAALRR